MKVINLTAHDVNICDYYGNLIKVYKPSGLVARVNYGWNRTDYVDDVPIVTQKDTKIMELPEPMEDVMFIVSSYVFDYCSERLDLLAPAHQIKVDGRVVGCKAFMKHG